MSNTGHGFGLGPLFAFEWLALTRRWQWYATRSLFAAALLAALLVILSNSPGQYGAGSYRQMANLGQNFYIAVIGTQLTLVLLAAPAATAGAICLDRASGRMTLMLVTDLFDSEIVLGKLASRLLPVFGLVACALPLLSILTLLGGVDPNALLGGFLVTLGAAVLGCSIALLFSLWVKRTHEALLGTYAVWALWLVGRPFLELINRGFGWGLSLPPRIADPYLLAFAPYWNPSSVTFGDYLWFLAITVGVAAILAVVAIFRLRAACTRFDVPRKNSAMGRIERIGAKFDPARYLPGPSLDSNPVFWREWHRSRPSRSGRIVAGIFVVGSVMASVGAILSPRMTYATAWVNGLQVSIAMLILSVTAASSLAEERARGSLDVLMTTALSTRQIVLGKWLGTFRLVPLLAVLPVIVAASHDPSREHYVATVILTLLSVLAIGAAATSLGLMIATWCARLGRAVALTVTCYVLVAVGWLFAATWVARGPDGERVGMVAPFLLEGILAADLCTKGQRTHVDTAFIYTVMYGAASIAMLGVTLLTFNHHLGRVEYGISRQIPGMSLPRKRVEIAGGPVGVGD